MKSKEELSVEIGMEIMEKYSTTIDYTPMFEDAAMRMAEELERWIPIEEELPEPNIETILMNKNWIDETNKEGTRHGFYDDNHNFYSAEWDYGCDEYCTSIEKPTNWRPINRK